MKIIRNNLIPFKGFKAVNLFGVLFVRGDAKIDKYTLNHEEIHTSQMRELFYIGFYVWYIVEWVVRLFMKGNAYRSVSFEREAYYNEYNMTYLSCRSAYSWIKFL